MKCLEKYSNILIVAGALVLVGAIIIRLANIGPLLENPTLALWRVSVAVLLLAIAIGVNK